MKLKKIAVVILANVFTAQAMANGFYGQLNMGAAFPYFSNTQQRVTLTQSLDNEYSIKTPSATSMVGAGLGYHWDFVSCHLGLGPSIYELTSKATGINTPFVNGGSGFPTLHYSAKGYITAIMFEPKLILTQYAWQPYVLLGAGIAWDHFKAYTETQTDSSSSARPTKTPFASHTLSAVSYESGIGIQRAVTMGAYAPVVTLDYRYMNFGNTSLGNANADHSSLSFGRLTANVLMLGIVWVF